MAACMMSRRVLALVAALTLYSMVPGGLALNNGEVIAAKAKAQARRNAETQALRAKKTNTEKPSEAGTAEQPAATTTAEDAGAAAAPTTAEKPEAGAPPTTAQIAASPTAQDQAAAPAATNAEQQLAEALAAVEPVAAAPPAAAEQSATAAAAAEKAEVAQRKGVLGLVGAATSGRQTAAAKAVEPRVNSLMQRLSSTFGFSSSQVEAENLDSKQEPRGRVVMQRVPSRGDEAAAAAAAADAIAMEDAGFTKKQAVSLLQLGAGRLSTAGGASEDMICDLKGCRPKPKKHDEL